MDPDAIALFRELADRSPSERQEYYARHQVSVALRGEVESLLCFDRDTADSLHGCVASAAEGVLRGTPADSSPLAQAPLVSIRAGVNFPGTDRFSVRRQLGAGGMGVVYEVHDHVRDEVVALKTLQRAVAGDIYRLKREFRSLTDIAHTNLVSLYELVVDGTTCFFTMELVQGVNFVEYVRGSAAAATPLHAQRIRHAFRQLVEGVGALHQRGKLHRDIKPSNVLVTSGGRVVILDFGLASDALPRAATWERSAGTPAYLAPERRHGAAPSESHDWYSVGVTLYEALIGRLPFDGRVEHTLLRERVPHLHPPADVAPDVPEDLNAICMGLLRRDPAHRLSGSQALQLLEGDAVGATGTPFSDVEIEPPFIGRRRHLDTLGAALSAAMSGSATTVYVHGPPGIGKSALVETFLENVIGREDVIVLRGRCHEHESVPYKALDGVIDSLSQHLSGLPRSHAESLLPSDLVALSRLFPVMLQVKSVASAYRRDRENAEPFMLRLRAFAALRELLTRLAARQPLIVCIDDLHWADADSAVLLEELFRPPQAPPILTVACFRTEEIASKPFLRTLLERAGSTAAVALPLDPMTDDEARTLLASVIPTYSRISGATLLDIAHEARGNPFLLRQLAGYLATHDVGRNPATFTEMMEDRLRSLPPAAQRFIETLAICGRPMDSAMVHQAAGLDGDERPLLARLRAAQLLRSSGSARRVELYHDRIREAIAATVPSERRPQLHRLIARTLVARGADDPESLFEHLREAGEPAEAASYAALAAKKADSALAFDRAAEYYRAALELTPAALEHLSWTERLAAALANAGRPAEAADAYLKAAEEVPATQRVELQRLAAEQLLIGGHIDRGLEVIRAVLQAVRLRLARSPRTALASLLWRRMQLRWRGLTFVERDGGQVPPAELLRVDTCWSVATGLILVDTVRASDFLTRHLLLALDTGDPNRIACALAVDAIYLSSDSGARRQKAVQCAARAEAIAARTGHPRALALCALGRGASAFLVGDWPAAQTNCDRAIGMLQAQSAGTIWELNTTQVFRLGALLYQGKLRESAREVAALLASAKGRGNLYFETELRTRMNLVWLVADEPDEGEQQANEALQEWSNAGFQRMHYNYMVDRIQTELYRGRARAAWQAIAENWTPLERALLFRVQFQRIEARYLRARCALLMAATEGNAPRLLSLARADARRIAREKMAWSDPLSYLLLATVAHLEGKPQIAYEKLAEAAAGFEREHMNLYWAVAKRRLGELAHDDVSQERGRQADLWMAAQGIVNPSCITRLIAPGFPDARE